MSSFFKKAKTVGYYTLLGAGMGAIGSGVATLGAYAIGSKIPDPADYNCHYVVTNRCPVTRPHCSSPPIVVCDTEQDNERYLQAGNKIASPYLPYTLGIPLLVGATCGFFYGLRKARANELEEQAALAEEFDLDERLLDLRPTS